MFKYTVCFDMKDIIEFMNFVWTSVKVMYFKVVEHLRY